MGHDTDVNGVGTLLNVGWNADPFPTNTTAPSVGLRFEFNRNDDASSGESSGRKRGGVGVGSAGGNFTLDFVYTTYSTTTRPLQVTSVFNMASDVFCNQAVNAIDWSCAYVPCVMVAFVFVFVVICCGFVVVSVFVYVCVRLSLSLSLSFVLALSPSRSAISARLCVVLPFVLICARAANLPTHRLVCLTSRPDAMHPCYQTNYWLRPSFHYFNVFERPKLAAGSLCSPEMEELLMRNGEKETVNPTLHQGIDAPPATVLHLKNAPPCWRNERQLRVMDDRFVVQSRFCAH